jgi:hypothetical protein
MVSAAAVRKLLRRIWSPGYAAGTLVAMDGEGVDDDASSCRIAGRSGLIIAATILWL